MRREGRQHGWIYAHDRALRDPNNKLRAVNAVNGPTANGGFVRVPRKPTNHSKFTGGAGCWGCAGKAKARLGGKKFKYDEMKMYYQEGSAERDERLDLYDVDS